MTFDPVGSHPWKNAREPKQPPKIYLPHGCGTRGCWATEGEKCKCSGLSGHYPYHIYDKPSSSNSTLENDKASLSSEATMPTSQYNSATIIDGEDIDTNSHNNIGNTIRSATIQRHNDLTRPRKKYAPKEVDSMGTLRSCVSVLIIVTVAALLVRR